uniref:CAAX prenyl protease n=1 Tax=Timema tahoe TaxID=61484 RepID=A0A7R9II73_9NEOP|nr:unnamed protein product [Timema tahoe]
MLTIECYIFYGTLVFLWLEFIWETYLGLRQDRVYKYAVEIPPELEGIFDEETYVNARLYGWDRNSFVMTQDTISIVTLTLHILFNVYYHAWNLSGHVLRKLGYVTFNETLQTVLFVFFMDILNVIKTLPISLYYTFILEASHGLNTQTVGLFLEDTIKLFVLVQLVVFLLVTAVIFLINTAGEYFFTYLWGFTVLLSLLLSSLFPTYIAPLFNEYTQLPEGELRSNIESLAASMNFPLSEIYIMETTSDSTSRSNAYFYGFWNNKRIVLTNNLLKQRDEETDSDEDADENKMAPKGLEDDEVLAIVAHELGHWQMNHIPLQIILNYSLMLISYTFIGFLFKQESLYRAFGFVEQGAPIFIKLVLILQFILTPYTALINTLLTNVSRRMEFQADDFAVSLGFREKSRRALIKIHKDNLSFPAYDWLYSTWYHSHPTLLERLHRLTED